jgi:Ca2+-binding RTX toxin-like protein
MATIRGNNSANTLTGTDAADTILGRGGNDRLSGLGGDDSLYGEAGDDVLDGGTGIDLLDGGSGFDIATYASLGEPIRFALGDRLVSIEGVVGTQFGDTLEGGDATADLIRGGDGDDVVFGGVYSRGSDRLYGGAGNDRIFGGEEIVSTSGTYAGFGDRLYGGAGDDTLGGLDGADRVFGEAGDDRLSGGPDRDVLTGGAGADTFIYFNEDVGIGSGTTLGDFGTDLVADFRRGTDRIIFRSVEGDPDDPATPRLRGFADLDSNRNGVLDDADLYVEVRAVSFGGTTWASTVIDVREYTYVAGEQSLTVFGVTGLRAGDFSDEVLA